MQDKITILLVEDELIVAKNIQHQLQKAGYQVAAIVDSGPEAISQAGKLKPNLVLMDIKLSGPMDGIEAARYIHDEYQIPVIYLTAYADDETFQRAKITDPYGYVIKPFELKRLSTAIEVAIYKHTMEKKLRESELRFRTLASSSPVGIFQADTHGHCIYVNERWCEIAGLTPGQARGQGWVNALHPEDRAIISSAWLQMAQSGSTFTHEYRFQTPEGKMTWVYGHAAPLKNDSAEKMGFIATITDITLRKKLEEELLNRKKLESIGILAGGIAHDFNNLLSVILGNISMLTSDAGITREHYQMLKSVEKATMQAAELAHQLVIFSKGGWLERQKITLPRLVQDTIQEQFPHKKNLFNLVIPGQLWPIDGDYRQLKQVFASLLLNALEASPEKETPITVAAENTEAPAEDIPLKKGQYIKISVIDQGIGIPKEHLGKIFDPYFTTKARGVKKGMGLGLTLCYSIIQKHEGYIQLASELGKGTTVEVYLPRFQGVPSGAVSQDRLFTPPSKKALVMDDEEIIRDVTRQMLIRLGYEVEIAVNGVQALETLEKARVSGHPIPVVFLELSGKKGPQAIDTQAKMLQINPKIISIAVSDFFQTEDRDIIRESGFFDILYKPFKLEDLKNMLGKIEQALLDRR